MAEVTLNGNVNFRLQNVRYFDGSIRNATGAEVTLVDGTVLEYDAANDYYVPYAGTTGSPTAILVGPRTIAAATTATGSVAVMGEVNADALTLPGSYVIDDVPTSNAGTVMAITAGGSNTGDGVPGAITQGSLAKAGTYTLTCTDASVSGSEVFQVVDPEGALMAPLTVAVAYDNGAFGVTIADGATDFIVGDVFTVVGDVAASGSIRLMLKENGILADDVAELVG